jgi:hypothetical protein
MVFPWFSYGFSHGFRIPGPRFPRDRSLDTVIHNAMISAVEKASFQWLLGEISGDFWRKMVIQMVLDEIFIVMDGMGWDVLITMCWNMEHGIINLYIGIYPLAN